MYNFTSLFAPQKCCANYKSVQNLMRSSDWLRQYSVSYIYKWPPCQQNFCLAHSILVYSRTTLHEHQVRSLLSMHGLFLGYSFESRSNNDVLAIVSLVMTIGLSINRWTRTRKKNILTIENKIDLSRSFGGGNFKSLTWFSQNLLFSSSLKKTKGDSALRRVMNEGQTIKT